MVSRKRSIFNRRNSKRNIPSNEPTQKDYERIINNIDISHIPLLKGEYQKYSLCPYESLSSKEMDDLRSTGIISYIRPIDTKNNPTYYVIYVKGNRNETDSLLQTIMPKITAITGVQPVYLKNSLETLENKL